MTLAAGANAHAAAAGNWRWLTGLDRTDDALFVGNPDDPLPAILALQFGRVVSLDRTREDPSAALAGLPDAGFDYAVLPGVMSWWTGGLPALFGNVQRALRVDGWVAMSGPRRGRPTQGMDGLRQAGFRDVRTYGLSPRHDSPYMVIPNTRRASLAFELDFRRQQSGNLIRVALAATGLHGLLYGGWLALARR